MINRHQKIIIIALGMLITIIAVFGLGTLGAAAATQLNLPGVPAGGAAPAASIAGKSIGGIGQASGTVLAVMAILYILRSVLAVVLGIVSGILNQLFSYNVWLVPGNISVVQTGWVIVRDIANAFFILILLWIAFTIIFNIENWGGGKLLTRVIVVALLINFSLAFVSAVFGFANVLASPFKDAIMGDNKSLDLAGIIVGKAKLQTITEQISSSNVLSQYQNRLTEIEAATSTQSNAGTSAQSSLSSALSYLGAPNTASAVSPTGATVITCGLGALLGVATIGAATPLSIAACLGGGIAATLASSLLDWAIAGATIAVTAKAALNMAIADILLLITIFALVTTSIVLMGRIIAMVFIGVLAPGALMLHLIPGGFTNKLWKDWVNALIKWAFFAPAFYFLFYISFKVLEAMSSGNDKLLIGVGPLPITGSMFDIFTLIVFLAFLFASISLARRMGITVADSFVKWGEKTGTLALGAAGGYVGGVISRAAWPLAGRGSGWLEKRIGESKSPLLRGTLSFPAKGLRRITAAGRKEVYGAQKELEGLTTQEIQRALGQGAYVTPAKRTAAILELNKRSAVTRKEGIEGYGDADIRAAVDQLKDLGDLKTMMDILKTNPKMALSKDLDSKDITAAHKAAEKAHFKPSSNDEAAQWYVWSRVLPSDIAKMDPAIFRQEEEYEGPVESVEEDKNNRQKQMFLLQARGAHLSEVGKIPLMASEVQSYLDGTGKYEENTKEVGRQLIKDMDPGTYRYFSSNIARELGWRLPEGLKDEEKPLAIVAEEALRIEIGNLRNEVRGLEKEFDQANSILSQFLRVVTRINLTSDEKEKGRLQTDLEVIRRESTRLRLGTNDNEIQKSLEEVNKKLSEARKKLNEKLSTSERRP